MALADNTSPKFEIIDRTQITLPEPRYNPLLVEEHIWGIITEVDSKVSSKAKGLNRNTIIGVPFKASNHSWSWTHILNSDDDFHLITGRTHDGTYFECEKAKVQLIKIV